MKNKPLFPSCRAVACFCALALAGALCVEAGGPPLTYPDAAGVKKIDEIIGAWKFAKPQAPRRVALVSQCFGYHHGDAIAHGYHAFRAVAMKTGAFELDILGDFGPLCDPAFLARYDAVLINSATHVKTKSFPGLEEALVSFVASGKGLCLVHAAVDSFYDSPVVQRLNGGLFWGHPWMAGGTWQFINEEPDHPLNESLKALGSPYRISDEIYMQCTPPYSRNDVRVLQKLDLSEVATSSALAKWNGGKRTDGDFAVTWVKPYGKGRVFYTSYGHDKRTFLDPIRLTLILNGLQYALGDRAAPDAPHATPGATRLEPVAGDATAAVQGAVDAAWQAGGGTVKLAKGVWNVKCLRLRSRTTLHLESGAVLQASRRPEDSFILDDDKLEPVPAEWLSRDRWDVSHSCSTNLFTTQPGSRWNNGFIRILNATDVAIVGEPGSVIDGMNPYDPDGEEYYRGVHGVSAINCRRLTFKGYTIQNTGNWAHRIADSADVVCEKLTILAGHDGVHITGCDRVRIADCTMKTGDDCVAGFDNQGVTVTGCLLNTACSGMRFGGTDVLVEKCTFRAPAEYGFRGSLTQEEKIAGVASKAPTARRNMLSVFTYYADGTHPVRIPGGNVVIRDCVAENTDRFLHYNYGNEKWQIGKPLADIRFERVAARGLQLPLCAHGDRDLPVTLTLADCTFAFREPVKEFVRGAFIRALDFRNVTIEGVKGPLLRLWGDRDAEIKADGVKGAPAEKARGDGRFHVGSI